MQKSFSVLILIFTTARVNGYLRSDCVCGVVNTESRRITNGVVVMPFKYPWMVAIFNAHKKAYCGGSLISDRHVTTSACSKRERITFWTYFQVLTAAHCVSWQKYVLPFRQKKKTNQFAFSPFAPDYWSQLFGKIKSDHVDYGEKMNFDAVYVHPLFKSHGSFDDYDLAILRFRVPIQILSQQVRPICVPDLSEWLNRLGAISLWSDYKMITVEERVL